MFANLVKSVVVCLMLVLFFSTDVLAEPYLAWDPSSGTVSGYRIYYGQSPGARTSSKEVGNVTQFPLSGLGLEEKKTYYFVTRAYNDVGESGDSNEVSWTVPDNTPPATPTGVTAR
jgi:hypothetical protein